MPAETVPAFVEAVAREVGYAKAHEVYRGGVDTLARWSAGLAVNALPPHLAEDFARALIPPPATAPPPDLADILRSAPKEVITLLGTEAGSGKTRAAMVVAGERASAGKRTVISVDKTSLAEQVFRDLETMGIPAQRYFGPLSHMTNGKPTCMFYEMGLALVAGGQSVQANLCGGPRTPSARRCPMYEECPARTGVEGPRDARVTVGTHGLLSALNTRAGKRGLLVIDEPPAYTESTFITRDTLEDLQAHPGWWRKGLGDEVRRVVDAAIAWAEDESPGVRIEEYEGDGEGPSVREIAAQVVGDGRQTPKLSVDLRPLSMPMGDVALARRVGRASGAITAMLEALALPRSSILSLQGGIRVVLPNDAMVEACRREGATVIADANAGIHAPIVEAVVGYVPRLIQAQFPDGAPVRRTHFARKASRSVLLSEGMASDAALEMVREAMQWVGTEPALFVTFRALLDDPRIRALLPPTVHTLHYGATRGSNAFKDLDCMVTVGDPRNNIDAVQEEAVILGAPWEGRVNALARAELEQAHGRLRTVWRTAPARAAHFGEMRPTGWGWTWGVVASAT